MQEEERLFKGFSCPDPGVYIPNISTLRTGIRPGMYTPCKSPIHGYHFVEMSLTDQKLTHFKDSVADQVISDIEKFWSLRSKFELYEFPYKRGILMHGPPGCGKTSTISLICRNIINRGGLVIKYVYSDILRNCLTSLRKIEPTAPVVILMEDIDYTLNHEDYSGVLNLLDGAEKFSDGMVYLATTNHFMDLEANIRNRPSRFDRIFKFDPPSAVQREAYLKSLLKENDTIKNLEQWVEDSDGFSFAHLKELFIGVHLFESSYSETLEQLRAMSNNEINDDDDDDDD